MPIDKFRKVGAAGQPSESFYGCRIELETYRALSLFQDILIERLDS